MSALDIQPVPQRRPGIERHGRCIDGGAQRAADRASRRRSPIPASCSSPATRKAGTSRWRRTRLLQETGATITASAPMSGPYAVAAFSDAVFFGQVTRTTPLFLVVHGDRLSEGVRRRLREPDRHLRSALRDRHRIVAAERSAAHAAVRRGQAAARSIVQQHAARSELRTVHAGDDRPRTWRPSSRKASVRSTW